jgi:PEP-CTERM motif
MGFDTTSPQNHSYSAAFTSSVGLGLLPSLGSDPNNVFPIDDNKFGPAHDGNFLIRANAGSVPEPSSLALCGIAGLSGLGYAWRRRRRAA